MDEMKDYNVRLSAKSEKELDKMKTKDKSNFELIISHMKNLEENPNYYGKPLTGNLKGLWSYRIGDFRIIYEIQDDNCLVFVITIGHRRDVYG